MAVPKLRRVAVFDILYVSSSAVVVWNKQREPAINSISKDTNGVSFFFFFLEAANGNIYNSQGMAQRIVQNVQDSQALKLSVCAYARK